ncbi:purine ribonucleoside efflux pump NepI [Klebsiella quasipneumoniae]|jgi:DHA1 family purine ribonucleoside efflux pump-like MFS transporter|uniref:purine ribonucleoside efflux pump NepI n=1 Tax=Klebsiella quasipneumoniae TaxID=1463165 RepID=UPI0004327C0E|nr:purine ribonucleoside efflux pump NepI [Klebsiella quasipneumoniae]MBY7164898.1 purine ribonucleoside efflux pump NepI [Klebsiella quasipneumoniae]MEB5916065.1 purine ribonucleoside efflux pump NepI [Klebsiella quasipneumoniae]UBH71285.1 purine ribonucleoside efflux pump NepI [Klebsiella quasipneumoniae]UDC44385.1 purine ribonucleoside efflux pump NepI [Klebsiella quasipneumoniae subsp. similipneumoniae]CDN09030.1 transporter [Klebsiella quasipneumoniae subsp. similipneumoniae]
MSYSNEAKPHARELARPNWSAVFAVAFCVACLITVEFLPVSLLTPMALDLGISEGMAGQSVTTTAFVAMFSSLFITSVIGKTDRRYVVILFSLLLTLSCLLVSFADSFTLLLLGRACLGLALGGFWAMSASLTMRLVPMRVVPKALSIIFGAVSIALVIAAPLGSFLGGLIGWRNVFNGAAVMGVLCTLWVLKALPSLPGESAAQQQNMFGLLKRPGVMAGMCAIFMAFAGQFAFFTYIRPVYMTLAGFDVDGLTLVLLSFGIASFIGTSLSSVLLKHSVKAALAIAPLVLTACAAALVLWGESKIVASTVAIIWGFAFALIPVGWSTWITRSLSDQAEKAGSIQVAVIQLANTCGAAVGGIALDHLGLLSPLVLSGVLMLFTGLLVAAKVKVNSPA